MAHVNEITAEHKRYALKIARECCYPKEVIEHINNAESDFEIDRILTQARLDTPDEDI